MKPAEILPILSRVAKFHEIDYTPVLQSDLNFLISEAVTRNKVINENAQNDENNNFN